MLDILASRSSPMLSFSGQRAITEFQRSLAANADFPETQLAIAGTALVFKDLSVADRAFSEAVRMDAQQINAWIMIARIRAAQGNKIGAIHRIAARNDNIRSRSVIKF
jgi:cytochrome c-type biogenesis protein CcmH/NrfG